MPDLVPDFVPDLVTDFVTDLVTDFVTDFVKKHFLSFLMPVEHLNLHIPSETSATMTDKQAEQLWSTPDIYKQTKSSKMLQKQ